MTVVIACFFSSHQIPFTSKSSTHTHTPVSPVVGAEPVALVVGVVTLVLIALGEDLDAVALSAVVPPLTLVTIAVLIYVDTVALLMQRLRRVRWCGGGNESHEYAQVW